MDRWLYLVIWNTGCWLSFGCVEYWVIGYLLVMWNIRLLAMFWWSRSMRILLVSITSNSRNQICIWKRLCMSFVMNFSMNRRIAIFVDVFCGYRAKDWIYVGLFGVNIAELASSNIITIKQTFQIWVSNYDWSESNFSSLINMFRFFFLLNI